MNALSTFNFESSAVRVITDQDGEPWFVAADVCAALSIGDTSKACSRLDDDERGTNTVRTPSGDQQMLMISEPGVYSLTLTSRKPEAKRFKRWVTHDVLPQIRRTGVYSAAPQRDPADFLNDPATMRSLLLGYTEKVLALRAEVETLAPKAEALDRFATASDGSFCLTDAAKALQVPPRKFFAKLQQMGWIHRRPMGSGWLAYQDRIAIGVMEHKVTTGEKSDGTEWASTQVRVTAKGMARLALVIAKEPVAA